MNEAGGGSSRYGESIGVYRLLVGEPEENHLEDPSVNERIILSWIFRK